MLVGAVEGAAIGAISGAIMGGVTGAIKGAIETGSWQGALKGALTGAIDGAADGFMWGAIGGAISGAMNPSYCFVAGTLVATAVGMKKIEEIKKGDIVETFNPYSNAYEENEVTEVYVNKTKELVHVNVEGEFVSTTPDHPFLTQEGWKKAEDLTTHDRLQCKDGSKEVLSIEFESLDKETNVYNFSVQGYHIYVVGRYGIVVHNGCSTGNVKNKSQSPSRNAAYREAKRKAGIPMSRQPNKVIPNVDRSGKPYGKGRTYIFNNNGNDFIQIMEHVNGHPEHGITQSHFNIKGVPFKWRFFF